MSILRIPIKIILFPLSLLLSLVTAFTSFILCSFEPVLNKISGILFFVSLFYFSRYFFGFPFVTAGNNLDLTFASSTIVIAFLLGSFGLPSAAMWIVERLSDLNGAIRSI